MLVADIPGKDQLGGGAALSDPDLDAGRTQQMAHIDEADHKAREMCIRDRFSTTTMPGKKDMTNICSGVNACSLRQRRIM